LRTILTALLLTASVPALAQTKKTAVYFHCTCDDTSGAALASAIRDDLAISPRYEEVSASKTVTYQLRMVTMDGGQLNEGYSTVYSAVVTFGPNSDDQPDVYAGHAVGMCGRNRVSSCAGNIIAFLDGLIHGN